MTLTQYAVLLRRAWPVLVGFVVLGVLAAGAYLLLTPARYTAVAKSFVTTSAGQDLSDLNQGSTLAQQSAQSYAEVATTPFVLDSVAAALGDGTSSSALAHQVVAATTDDSVIITISATDESPERAARIADSTARYLSAAVGKLAPDIADKASAVRITQVESAAVPRFRSSPSIVITLLIGVLLGLALGFAAMVVSRNVDTRYKTVDELARIAGRPVLGVIGNAPNLGRDPVFMRTAANRDLAEGMRGIRTNLRFTKLSTELPIITVTSSLPAEGKSTAIINLAIAMADAGEKVLLIDADLRRPSIASYLAIDGAVGLTDVLIEAAEFDQAVQRWGDRDLWVLPSGELPPNPSEMLQSEAMRALLQMAHERGHSILIDAPPLLSVADAAILSANATGVLLVAAASRVRGAQLRAALGALDQVGAHVLGVLATRVVQRDRAGYGTYGYYGHVSSEQRHAQA